jgi:hypothetical protein
MWIDVGGCHRYRRCRCLRCPNCGGVVDPLPWRPLPCPPAPYWSRTWSQAGVGEGVERARELIG